MSASTGAGAPTRATDSVSTLTLQLSLAAHSTPTVLLPAVRSTFAVTVAHASQLLVAGSVSVCTSEPLTTRSIVRGAGPPSAPM
jgi:hypothetical protein